MAIHFDLSRLLAAHGVTGGIAAADWASAPALASTAHAAVQQRLADGQLGFLALPTATDLQAQVATAVAAAAGRYDDVVALGIGGSALGALALRTSLRPYGWNLLGADRRDGWPRLHVVDTPDPRVLTALLDLVDLRRTLFLVVSKSGGTAETMGQYLVARAQMQQVHGETATQHFMFVTDPVAGPLRALAKADGIHTLDVPSNVGGRFSVLSPVGTLPAALAGIDTVALLAGAGAMAQRCATDNLATNPAQAWAALQWLSHAKNGRGAHVMMPYCDALRDIAGWFVQLWAESLGKITPAGLSVGPTPIAAVGPNDQHSLLQALMEGTDDKTVTFIREAAIAPDVTMPNLHPATPEASYLGGHGLGELMLAEQQATAAALTARGRPTATVTVDAVDPWHVGGLLMWLQCATIYAAGMYGVNPLDQPGVELGKRYTGALLGRQGTGAEKAEYDGLGGSVGQLVI